jgi:hypothetical protein
VNQSSQKLNMHEPTVFRICIQGELDQSWFDYFSAQSVSVEMDQDEQPVTVFTSEPMDQGALVGLINHLNDLGIPLISVDPIRKE